MERTLGKKKNKRLVIKMTIRVSEKEARYIVREARKRKLSLAEFIREALKFYEVFHRDKKGGR